jgi:hypothetical protein
MTGVGVLDHLVMGAASLQQAAAWCERELGVAPLAGGRHALMGTHNGLLALASPEAPRAYLEFIAIDPEAEAPTAHRRWFGLDDPATQARLAQGPALLHWVAGAGDLPRRRAALRRLGLDPGEPVAAQRGLLRWQISIRPDGQPQLGGALPTEELFRDDATLDALRGARAGARRGGRGARPHRVLPAGRRPGRRHRLAGRRRAARRSRWSTRARARSSRGPSCTWRPTPCRRPWAARCTPASTWRAGARRTGASTPPPTCCARWCRIRWTAAPSPPPMRGWTST